MQNFLNSKIPVKDNKASSLLHLANTELKVLYEPSEIENISDWLLEHFTNITKSQLLRQPDMHVNQSCIIYFCNALEELKKGVPVQYVIGTVDFYQLKLKVNPSVLIPRPETEQLVDIIIQENKERKGLKILDIGTGSGCIAISLAKNLEGSMITAIDISKDALIVAKENAKNNGIFESKWQERHNNIEFLELNFLEENYFIEKEFDIIVSNPPYIVVSEKEKMDKNVVDFEPHKALFVPDNNPFIFYENIMSMATNHLKIKGLVYVEINEKMSEETAKIFQLDSFSSVILLKDMFGKNRFIKAEKNEY